MHDYWRQQEIIKETLQKQLETELSFLKNQINPHFLFNTLNNLYALALQKSDAAPDAILKLSSILRYILYESDTPTVSFEKEKEIMQAYIELELLRLSDKEQLHFNITTDKPYDLPPLLWLPVLENVFKHGTRTMSEKNPVEFNFEIKNGRLSVYSKNNDKMLVGSNGQPGGVGLNNLKKRLELLYPNKHRFETKSENNFYVAQIQIDLS
jgi:LytS/YehU family sensor histidine kinase